MREDLTRANQHRIDVTKRLSPAPTNAVSPQRNIVLYPRVRPRPQNANWKSRQILRHDLRCSFDLTYYHSAKLNLCRVDVPHGRVHLRHTTTGPVGHGPHGSVR